MAIKTRGGIVLFRPVRCTTGVFLAEDHRNAPMRDVRVTEIGWCVQTANPTLPAPSTWQKRLINNPSCSPCSAGSEFRIVDSTKPTFHPSIPISILKLNCQLSRNNKLVVHQRSYRKQQPLRYLSSQTLFFGVFTVTLHMGYIFDRLARLYNRAVLQRSDYVYSVLR